MNIQNKQRIIGIVVIVAFLALLIPFLFTSGPKKNADTVPANPSMIRLPTFTKKAPDANVGQQKPAEVVPLVAPAPAPQQAQEQSPQVPDQDMNAGEKQIPVAVNPPQGASGNENLPPQMMEAQQQPAAETQNAPVAQEAKPVAQVIEKKEKPVTTKAIKTTSKTTSKKAQTKAQAKALKAKAHAGKKPIKKSKSKTEAKTTVAKGKNFWAVQIGSFEDKARVAKLTKEIHGLGYHVYTQKVTVSKGVTLTRVMVGHETSKDSAEKIAKHLEKSLKLSGTVTQGK